MGSGKDNKVRKRLKNAFLENFFRETYNNLNYSLYLCRGLGGSLFQDIVDKKKHSLLFRV